MNYMKRALTSITRQLSKTIILLIIVFVLGSVMFSTLLVSNSVAQTKNNILKTMPPIVTLEPDQAVIEEILKEDQSPEGYIKIMDKFATGDIVEKVATSTSNFLKTYDYELSRSFVSKSLKAVNITGDTFGGIGNFGEEERYFRLKGVNTEVLVATSTEDAKLQSGRSFTKEELNSGADVVIISKEFAKLNDLNVGDTFRIEEKVYNYSSDNSLKNAATSIISQTPIGIVTRDVTVIGVLEYKDSIKYENFKDDGKVDMSAVYNYQEKVNSITSTNKFNSGMEAEIYSIYEANGIDTAEMKKYATRIDNITFVLNDIDEVDAFILAAKAIYNEPVMSFTTQLDKINQVAQPLSNMVGVLNIVLIGAIAASILILTLVLLSFAKDRRKEVGIYLALGERKSNIMLQFIAESAVVGFIGMLLASVAGMIFAGSLSSLMLESPASYMGNGGYMSIGVISYEEIYSAYQVGISLTSVATFIVIIMLTIILAQTISALMTLRLDPKKIMM